MVGRAQEREMRLLNSLVVIRTTGVAEADALPEADAMLAAGILGFPATEGVG